MLKVSRTVEKKVEEFEPMDKLYYSYNNLQANKFGDDNTKDISINITTSQVMKKKLGDAHKAMREVFDESLQGGYNGYFGPHECRLNWAGKERPPSNKLRVANYNHAFNGLLQEVMDDMTRQGVLQDPQQLGITVQSVCPVFLQRKKRAKDKPKELVTKKDVRMLINFGPVNDKIKDVPTPMTTTDDIFYVETHHRPGFIQWLFPEPHEQRQLRVAGGDDAIQGAQGHHKERPRTAQHERGVQPAGEEDHQGGAA